MNVLRDLHYKYIDVVAAFENLKEGLQVLDDKINDLSSEVVDIEDYQGLKDDIADYIIAVQTDNEDGQAVMLKYLMGYFSRDERENIAKEIEKGDRH